MNSGSNDDPYVNPEPPPEIAKIPNEDLIGDTMFSKHWLFELLLKLIKQVENEEETPGPNEIECNMETRIDDEAIQSKSYALANFKEVDASFEKDLCELWDMSVERSVCVVLDEVNSIKIFEGFIRKFDNVYPRAVEILLGIMINMASLSDSICDKIVSNKSLIQYILFNILSQMADVPTMIQVVRFFDVILSDSAETAKKNEDPNRKKAAKHTFIDYLKNELNVDDQQQMDMSEFSSNWNAIIEKFYFILEQSLNPQLLDNTCSLLFNLFDCDEQILSAFCQNERIVDALCSAVLTRVGLDKSEKVFFNGKFTTTRRGENESAARGSTQSVEQTPAFSTQTSEDDISTIDHLYLKYFMCLQTLSTCEPGVVALFNRSETVIQLFDGYLDKCLSTFNDWEIKSSHSIKASVGEESLRNMICVLSILNCLFPENQLESLFDCHKKNRNFFKKIITLCKYYLRLFREFTSRKEDPDENSEEQTDSFNLAKSNMKDLFTNLAFLDDDGIEPSIKQLLNDTVPLLYE